MAVPGKPRRKLSVTQEDLGRQDSVRAMVLTSVSSENYPKAIELLRKHVDAHPEYPQFRERSIRYLNYAVDLVNGIKAKRSFPGMTALPANKQEELFNRAYEHFEDLKVTIKKVERIEREVRLEDKRATVWMVRATMNSAFAIVILGFFLEVKNGGLEVALTVVDDSVSRLSSWLLGLIGL